MAVHHFTAPDLVVAQWKPIETFPQDGTIVEVQDASGFTCKAQWHSGRILAASLSMSNPDKWRPLVG